MVLQVWKVPKSSFQPYTLKAKETKKRLPKITAHMRTIYVTAKSAPPNQLTAHNIKASSFVTIGQTQLHQLTSADDDGTSLFL
jgi:hypothetical protein